MIQPLPPLGEPGGPPATPSAPVAHALLDYGKADRTMRPAAQWCLGITAGAVPVLAAAFFAPFVAGTPGAIVGPLLVAAVPFGIGMRLRRGIAYRPLAAGIWTGLALAALIDGLCIAALSGVRFGG